MQLETEIDHNKPDLIFLEKIYYIGHVACLFDPQIVKKKRVRQKNFLQCFGCNLCIRDGFENIRYLDIAYI